MRRRLVITRLRVLIALLLGSVLLSGCDFNVYKLPLPGGADVGDNPMTLTIYFEDVLDLVPKSSVKVNDVSVGQVTDIALDGYTAKVTVQVRDDVDLPDNAEATIRQTSLLGEKFVSLAPPANGATGELGDGETIPLERTGRNPEIEEVLGALSLVLNGGGVARLKDISTEVNAALEGREESAKSVLTQVANLMGQLDDHKQDIVDSIESLNRLAVTVREQQGSIDAALEELPSALDSLDRQRGDLVRMLQALDGLGRVGTDVIRRSKASTIYALRQLQPLLTQLANSGDALVNSMSVAFTYPFVDEVVGRDPQVARNLHMGDYTNLSITLDIDVADLPEVPGIPCTPLSEIPNNTPLGDINLDDLCQGAQDAITTCLNDPSLANCQGLPAGIINSVCDSVTLPLGGLCGGGTGPGPGPGGPGLPPVPGVPNIPLPGLPLNRAGTGTAPEESGVSLRELMTAYDPALVVLLGGATA